MSFAQGEDFPEVSNLREDIQIINLLNSLAQRIIDKIPHFAETDEAKAKEEILVVFERVRVMEGVDFQLKKSFITKELEDKLKK